MGASAQPQRLCEEQVLRPVVLGERLALGVIPLLAHLLVNPRSNALPTRERSLELEVFGILSSYLNHLYWLYRLLGSEGAHGPPFPEYHASTALLLFYWLVFRVSYVIRKVKSPAGEHVSTAAAVLNTLLLLGVMKFQSVQPELAFVALLLIGAVEFGFGQLPLTKRRREAFIILTVLGAALMIAAVPFRYSGNNVAILWLIGAEALIRWRHPERGLVAPAQFADESLNYDGYRAGIRRVNGSWKFAYFVNG